MVALDKYRQDKALIVETGLMAIKQGDEESAKKLFTAAGLLDPKGTTQAMGFGLIAIHKLDIPEAQKRFNQILKQEPTNGRALAFMAFTHMLAVMDAKDDQVRMTHLKKSAELAENAMKTSNDPSIKEMAQSILNWEHQLQHLEKE